MRLSIKINVVVETEKREKSKEMKQRKKTTAQINILSEEEATHAHIGS